MLPLNIALVLAGGASKGAQQAGFLKAVSRHIPMQNISVVTSSSMGCLNAYAYLTDKIELLEKVWKSFDWQSPFRVLREGRKKGNIESYIDMFLSEEDFLQVPLYVTTSVIPKFSVYYWKFLGEPEDTWHPRLRQALSFPFVTMAKRDKLGLHSDGGAFDNIPVYPIKYHDNIDLVLIVHFDPRYRPPASLFDGGKIVVDTYLDHNASRGLTHFDFSAERLIAGFEEGYTHGDELLTKLFADAESKQDVQKNAFSIYRDSWAERRKKYSFITLVTKMNTLFDNLIE